MPLIKDLSSIPDLTVVSPAEYDLRVITAKEVLSKNTGRNSIMLVCEIVGEENAQNLIHSIWLPMESDDETKAGTMWRMIKDFTVALGLEGDLELDDFKNLEFTAVLEIEKFEDYGDRNIIKRIT